MKLLQASMWILVSISVGLHGVLLAKPRKSMVITKKFGRAKKRLLSVRSSQNRAKDTKKSALTYLPKLQQYVKPLQDTTKKATSQKKTFNRTSPTKKVFRKKKSNSRRVRGLNRRPLSHDSKQPVEKIFIWPVDPKNFWISSPFGPRTIRGRRGFHGGIDLAAPTGTDVYAAASGTVTESRYSSGYGNYIMIVHDNGYKTRYAHLSRSLVTKGQELEEGELIGKVGATGRIVKRSSSSSGAHLHFEVYRHGQWVDPLSYMRQSS